MSLMSYPVQWSNSKNNYKTAINQQFGELSKSTKR